MPSLTAWLNTSSAAAECVTLMAAGGYVDDETMLAIIRARLSEADAAKGFILDGFPRTIAQADGLSKMLAALGTPLDAVCAPDALRGAWLPAIAERPARALEDAPGCRWRYVLRPFSALSSCSAAFVANTLQIIELK